MGSASTPFAERPSGPRRRWVWIAVLVSALLLAAIAAYGFDRIIAVYQLYWSSRNIERLFYEDLGLSRSWSSFIAVVGSFFYGLAWVPLSLWTYRVLIWRFNSLQFFLAFGCWVFVYGHVPLLHALLGADACFNQRTGAPMKWYVQDANGRINLFDSGGFDPVTQAEKRPVTPAVCSETAKLSSVPQQISAEIDIIEFFDPVSGRARVWYYKASDGNFELFSSSGFHPRTGEALRPVTKEIATEIRYWAEHGGPKVPKLPSSIISNLPSKDSPDKAAIDELSRKADLAWRAGNFGDAMNLLRQAAAKGDGDAMFGIGRMYRDGFGVGRNYDEAIRWFSSAVGKGNLQAVMELGRLYLFGIGVAKDAKTARSLYSQAASMGNAEAMTVLGVMSLNGDAVPQEFPKALEWFRRAAYKGDERAMFYIGYMDALGYGTPQNYSEALRWYNAAADRGELLAMNALGFMYLNGQGMPNKDPSTAMQWFKKAAEKGYGPAIFNVGTLFQSGNGVPKDYKEAMNWYRSAADIGEGAAMDAIGVLYAQGLGTKKDCIAAKQWFQKAVDSGNPTAKERLIGNVFCTQ